MGRKTSSLVSDTTDKRNTGCKKALIPRGGNDVVYTPDSLAREIVDRLPITGTVLEPCKGGGAFLRALAFKTWVTRIDWCEIVDGEDFFDYTTKVDWIVTNPPWSLFADFLEHSLKLADNVVFLVTLNHFTTKKRLRLLRENGFWFKKIWLTPTPKAFPQSGFQVAVVWVSKDVQEDSLIADF